MLRAALGRLDGALLVQKRGQVVERVGLLVEQTASIDGARGQASHERGPWRARLVERLLQRTCQRGDRVVVDVVEEDLDVVLGEAAHATEVSVTVQRALSRGGRTTGRSTSSGVGSWRAAGQKPVPISTMP